MPLRLVIVFLLLASIVVICSAAPPVGSQAVQAVTNDDGVMYFEKHIRPLLTQQCQSCHGPQKQKGGLRLDSPESIRKGGDSGVIVQAGDPAKSLMFKAVGYHDEPKMPPRGKLSDEQIAHVRRWIELGASLPASSEPEKTKAVTATFDLKERLKYWSYQPLQAIKIPVVSYGRLPLTTIDPFIDAKLKENGLLYAQEVDKTTWLRRVTFDLTGLPPTLAEIEDFNNVGAYDRVVDRLLSTDDYAVRWARHWLDLMRYADTLGHEFDFDLPNAWRYRNYVISALNDDIPYNQFVLEHLAGDVTPNPRMSFWGKCNLSIQATGFLWLGEGKQAPVDVRQEQADRIDNQIDVIGKAFLGQTIACARCHDHKFDAIATRDYYALYGILKSSRYQQAAIDDDQESKAYLERLRDMLKHIEKKAHEPFDELKKAMIVQETSENPPVDPKYHTHRLEVFVPQGLAWQRRDQSTITIYHEPKTKKVRLRSVPGDVWDSGILSEVLEGSLRTPTFDINQRYLHLEAAGWGGRIRVVVDGFAVIRDPIYGGLRKIVNEPLPKWYTFDLNMWKGRQVYVEFLDGGPADLSLTQDHAPGKEAWLQIRRMVSSDEGIPPKGLERPFIDQPVTDQAQWQEILEERAEMEKHIPAPRYALATAEGTGSDEAIFTRGNPRLPGSMAPRGLSAVFCGAEPIEAGTGSGRLQLAERLIDPKRNPFIARVIVNRVWKHHFGQGLVRSVDDFGHMGEAPSHPELLDHLANWFIKNGWSLKKLHREMVLSQTYRQSSKNDPAIVAKDPQNRLLSRMPVRRLEAEAIRDAMLAVSGRLDKRHVEEGVMPYLTSLMQGRGRPSVSGPLDGNGRRSIYLSVRRNFLPPLFTAFDFPTPFTAIGRRSASNIPAQSLTMMNDPLVKELAQKWAAVMIKQYPDREKRIEAMSLMAYGHVATRELRSELLDFLSNYEKNNSGDENKAWTEIAHALFCSKEFIYVP